MQSSSKWIDEDGLTVDGTRLRGGRRAGPNELLLMKPPDMVDPVDAATTSLTLALRQSRFGRAKEPCQTLGSPMTRRLEKGESIGIAGGTLAVVYLPAAGDASNPLRFSGANRPRLLATTGPLTLRLSPVAGTKPVRVCA